MLKAQKLNKLLEITKNSSYDDRDELIEEENKIAQNYKYIQVRKNKKYKKLLFFTSLPYTFVDIDFDLKDIWKKPELCEKCGSNVRTNKKALPTGNLNPKWMIVGEAPGEDDEFEEFNRAWVDGPSSEILSKALYKLGIYYDSWFTNILKCATPGNTNVTQKDAKNCFPYLKNEFKLLKPKNILILGNNAKEMMPQKIKGINIYHFYHPAYFLYRGRNYKDYTKYLKEEIK